MPTISVSRDLLFQGLGRSFTDTQFDELCFDFGIELDEVTSERKLVEKEHSSGGGVSASLSSSLSDEVIYKIEVPANRYDMLSLEGLIRALRVFLGVDKIPKYIAMPPVHTITVHPSVLSVRPVVVCAILRNIKFTQASYDSFIDLQDKLHSGIGRRRQLVSMGTHDLDTVQGPFTYEAVSPENIVFKPLNQQVVVDGHGMIKLYEQDLKIRKFLHLIRDSPVYPVILDKNRTVMSVPPIINSDHSKISLHTRNVFIDVTAMDLTRALVALTTLVTDFSVHCEEPFSIEQVKVVAEGQISPLILPDLSTRQVSVPLEYINRSIGLKLSPDQVCAFLKRMGLEAECNTKDSLSLNVLVPPIRSDIMHPCDVMEDVAIAYGFNNLPKKIPQTPTISNPYPLNKLSDAVREEVARCGFTEILALTLCSRAENYSMLRLRDDDKAVSLANPKTIEYEVVHTTLVPGVLKTLASNKAMPLPLKIFQLHDICLLDVNTSDTGARNERRLCAAWMGQSSGFETVHGLLDRIMNMLSVKPEEYKIQQAGSDAYFTPMYLDGRAASVVFKEQVIGHIGVVHPEVLHNFGVPAVCSLFEINIEPFL